MKRPYRNETTQDRVRQLLTYDPETGIFLWREKPCERICVGRVAGHVAHGYRIITVDHVRYRAHRLAFLYMEGRWPTEEVDHINMDRGDNRWVNLREASSSQNKQNRGLQRNNTTGVRGVSRYGDRFRAQIKRGGRPKTLGYFDTFEEAVEFRQLAAAMLHGEFMHAIERS